MRRRKRRTFLYQLTWITLIGGLSIFTLGLYRYGGPEGLWRRAQVEMAALRPHPIHVPTPLAVGGPLQAGLVAPPARSLLVSHEAVVLLPTVTPTPLPGAPATEQAGVALPTPTPTLAYAPAAPTAQLTGLQHFWQTWNNCGPATLAMQLSYFGGGWDQATIGAALRTHEDDKNVLPEELVAYARSQGYEAGLFVNGDADRLRLLLSNGLPVLVETWLEDEPGDGMGHYRLLVGYDDARREWIGYDSYDQHHLRNPDPNGPYQGISLPYDKFAALWQVFNHTYILVYPSEKRPLVEGILGADADPAQMWQRAFATAQRTAAENPTDAFAWFNLGSDLVAMERYEDAAAAFDEARRLGLPWRMLWYQFGPFVAYHEIGRYQELVALAEATIATTNSIEELFYWRGMGLTAMGDPSGARQAWQQALQLNPGYTPALEAMTALAQ
jgi:tetratricopeptide (TPR) repeat protein